MPVLLNLKRLLGSRGSWWSGPVGVLFAPPPLLKGRTVVVDSTTLEANAAMKSIVRKDTGEDWKAYLRRLMQEQGLIEPGQEPTDEELRRFDQQRKDKRVSNDEWQSKTDPDSRIALMKARLIHTLSE